jgi:hypothetical protein
LADSLRLAACLTCAKEIDKFAKVCPNCGRENPTREYSSGCDFGGGGCGCLVAIIVSIWAIIEAIFGDPEYVQRESKWLESYYGYSLAKCEAKEIKDEYFVRCYSENNQSNAGIYAIRDKSDGGRVLAVNDSAKQKRTNLKEYNGSISINEIEAAFD